MRQLCFCNLLIMFIFVILPVHQVLYLFLLFSILSYFFDFIFFFFIDNCQWRYWIHVLSFELWCFAFYQQVFIKHIVYHPSFWKLQLKLLKVENDGLNFSYSLSSFYFCFYFLGHFLFLKLGLGLRVMRLHCHTLVTSENMIIVMVTSHMFHKRIWKILKR